MTNRRGFTLIELLVVVAIIAILAAILFPVFAQAREKARQTGCLSNLKQWSQAALMYTDDFDEYFVPLFVWDNRVAQKMKSWPMLLSPYVKLGQTEKRSDRLQECPTTALPPGEANNLINFPFFRSYGHNGNYLGAPGWGAPVVNAAQVAKPAETVFFCDTYAGLADARAGYFHASPPSRYNPQTTPKLGNWWELRYVKGGEYYGRMTQRHSGGSNIVWVDGHVRWMKLPGAITDDDTLWDRK